MSKKIFAIIALAALLPLGAGAMHNPSTAYCLQMGFPSKVITTAAGQYSLCTLPDGKQADSWGLVNGKISTKYNYCELYGLKQQVLSDPKLCGSAFSKNCFACVDAVGKKTEMIATMRASGYFPNLDDGFRPTGAQSYLPLVAKPMPKTFAKPAASCRFLGNIEFSCPSETLQYVRPALNIVFVLDQSATMRGAPLNNAKAAIKGLLAKLDKNFDKVALVGFGAKGKILLGMSSDYTKAAATLEAFAANERLTNIADGILQARNLLSALPISSTSNSRRNIIVLVSDGVANAYTKGECPDSQSYPTSANTCTKDALNQAFYAKFSDKSPAKIYTIGFNFAQTDKIKTNAGAFAKSLMKNMASLPATFSESEDLSKISITLGSMFAQEKSLPKNCEDVFAYLRLNPGISYLGSNVASPYTINYNSQLNSLGIAVGNVASGQKVNFTLNLANGSGQNSGTANDSAKSYWSSKSGGIKNIAAIQFLTNCK